MYTLLVVTGSVLGSIVGSIVLTVISIAISPIALVLSPFVFIGCLIWDSMRSDELSELAEL